MNNRTVSVSLLALATVVAIGATALAENRKPLPDPAAAQTAVQTAAVAQTEFTLETLKAYNGRNGAAAYIAVDGVVYDASAYFENGNHNGVLAGNDLSAAFQGQHSASMLNRVKAVGVLKTDAPIAPTTPAAPVAPTAPTAPAPVAAAKPAATQTEFTLETLKAYNGRNGAAAYIAVDGVVYDASAYFENGNHNGVLAGSDLSAAFHGQHSASMLNRVKAVGVLKTDAPAAPVAPTAPAAPAPVAAAKPAATETEFTLETLKAYNGRNGAAAYIAVDGVVYDASAYFENGNHNGISAGKDVSTAFHGEHSASKLTRVKAVGVLKTDATAQTPAQKPVAPVTTGNATRDALLQELQKIQEQDWALEQKEDALEAAYRAGTLRAEDYRTQDAALERQEAALDLQEKEVERQLAALDGNNRRDDDDDDGYDDHDDDNGYDD